MATTAYDGGHSGGSGGHSANKRLKTEVRSIILFEEFCLLMCIIMVARDAISVTIITFIQAPDTRAACPGECGYS